MKIIIPIFAVFGIALIILVGNFEAKPQPVAIREITAIIIKNCCGRQSIKIIKKVIKRKKVVVQEEKDESI